MSILMTAYNLKYKKVFIFQLTAIKAIFLIDTVNISCLLYL